MSDLVELEKMFFFFHFFMCSLIIKTYEHVDFIPESKNSKIVECLKYFIYIYFFFA